MFNPNPGSKQPPALMVDRQFGKSYHIIKSVYNKLPIIENLDENADLSFIVENFEEFQKINNVANDVVRISDHLDEILLADDNARIATNFAKEAKDWAIKLDGTINEIDYSSKYYALNAQNSSEKTEEYLNESKELNKEIQPLKEPIQKVSDNIKDIKTAVASISDINIVASDLEAELLTNASQDMGMVGEEEPPVQSISGGNIKVAADNINDINVCADNINYIIDLAKKVDSIPDTVDDLIEIAERTEKAAKNAETTLTEITGISNTIKQEASKVSAEGTKQLGLLGAEGNKQISLIKKETNKSITNIQNAEATVIVNAENSALQSIESKKEETINIFNTYKEETNNLSNRIEEINSSFEDKVVVLKNNEENLNIVSSSIDSILKVSSEIEDISLVRADLEGSFDIGGVIDYGNLDDPNSGSAVITGGNIYIVAQNIDAVKKVAENIDNLPNPGEPGDVDLSNYYTKEETDNKIAEAIEGISSGGSNNAYDIIYGESNVGAILDDLLYVAIAITSFTSNIGNQEKGSVVNNITLSWNYNKLPETLTLNNESLDVSTKNKVLTNQNITSNKTWTLKATDSRGAVSQKNVSISFLNGVYYGIGSITESSGITNEFIQGLTKVLASSRNRTFSVNAGTGQYIYYAIPVAMGKPTFYVGGFEGGFDLLHTFLYTNSKGYSENYYVYKSTNSSLGSTSVEVK